MHTYTGLPTYTYTGLPTKDDNSDTTAAVWDLTVCFLRFLATIYKLVSFFAEPINKI